jgi:hypothetical protein
MKHISRLFWMIVWTAVLAGCIKVELKDERTIPKLYEVALVTYTPEGWSPEQPTATKLPASPTLVPSPTATRTITPSATLPPPPSATPTSPTPMITGTILTNVWCKQGPGFIYPGMRLLVTEEGFILLGRNSDASWWWIQPSLGDISCWVPTMVINLPQPLPGVPVLTAQATPQSQPLHSTPVPTKKPRVRSPQSTTGPTDTPNPYPNPYPYPAP